MKEFNFDEAVFGYYMEHGNPCSNPKGVNTLASEDECHGYLS